MSQEPPQNPPSEEPAPSGGTFQQELQHSSVSARVPERVSAGVFSTGAVVMHGLHEFVIDFLLSLAPPRRVSARVVLPPTVLPLFIAALQDNLQKFQQNFGPPPRLPAPPPGTVTPPITEVYEQIKLPDEVLSGVYANTVMIVHSPSEFCFDFITSFYPRSAVACRVFLAAPHVPQLLESLTRSFEQFRRRQPPHGRPPEETPPPTE